MNLCYFVFFAIFTTKFPIISKLNTAYTCFEDEKVFYVVVDIENSAE